MNNEEYKIEFEEFKKNVNAYVPKHECKIFYFHIFAAFIIFIFITKYVFYQTSAQDLFKIEYMFTISCLLMIVSFCLNIYFFKINKEVLKFKNYIYTGKLSDLLDIKEPTVQLRKDYFKKIIELKNGIPSEIICDLYKNIIAGVDKEKYLKSLNIKEIIEDLN